MEMFGFRCLCFEVGKESIENCGILTPLLVRPLKDGSYEIISGHRRKHAAQMLGLKTVPVIIRKILNV